MSGLLLSAVLALAEAWLGLTLAYHTDWPVSFCIAVLSALGYFTCLGLPALWERQSQAGRANEPA